MADGEPTPPRRARKSTTSAGWRVGSFLNRFAAYYGERPLPYWAFVSQAEAERWVETAPPPEDYGQPLISTTMLAIRPDGSVKPATVTVDDVDLQDVLADHKAQIADYERRLDEIRALAEARSDDTAELKEFKATVRELAARLAEMERLHPVKTGGQRTTPTLPWLSYAVKLADPVLDAHPGLSSIKVARMMLKRAEPQRKRAVENEGRDLHERLPVDPDYCALPGVTTLRLWVSNYRRDRMVKKT
jgi:hypothetical protein